MIGEINFCIAANDFMRVSVVVYYSNKQESSDLRGGNELRKII